MKITLIGDIMCEPCVLDGAREKDGSYNFDTLYSKVKPLFDESDYVIGNIEVPLAGEEAKYTDSYYVFNAPDEFARATKRAGIDMVSTINNHTLDRGPEGMYRTIKVLDEIGLPHTGSFLPEKGREEAAYFEIDGVKIALVAYTYTTNKRVNPDDEFAPYMNCLVPYDCPIYLPYIRKKMNSWVERVFKKVPSEKRSVIRKWVGLPNAIARSDDYIDFDAYEPYQEKFMEDIREAKKKADFVIAYPHVGGQFENEPGARTKYSVYNATKAGADAVIASHSHTLQRAYFKGDVPCAYSLGNFSMSCKSSIVWKKAHPEYGIAIHLYLDGAKLEKVTFSILEAVQNRGESMISWPVDELYASLKSKKKKKKLLENVKWAYKIVTGKDIEGEVIRREYELEA